jgi:uncharacterized protein YndB with AHSA1/START domain
MTATGKASSDPASNDPKRRITIERKYKASVKDVWEMWATAKGLESWWGPGGFATKVNRMDLRPGGELHYTMSASGPDQIAFMKNAGMPLDVDGTVIYTEIVPYKLLAYTHLADFIPGVKPYDVATTVEFRQEGKIVHMVVTFDAMHSDEWTQRATMGWDSQLAKFSTLFPA